MRPLFVGGCQRSGTTAFEEYINCHEAVLVTRERYKFLDARDVTPDLFTFERILDYRENETNAKFEYHQQLLARKDPSVLKWVGDKNPSYVRFLPTLLANHPDARFILLYRPLEEVAESFEAKARNPRDRWPEENGFEHAIKRWNQAQQHTRRFVEEHPGVGVLVIDYHDFFGDATRSVPMLSSFLELEFGREVREAWGEKSQAFRKKRREKTPLSSEQAAVIEKHKDHESERWIRDYIRGQVGATGRRRGRFAVGWLR